MGAGTVPAFNISQVHALFVGGGNRGSSPGCPPFFYFFPGIAGILEIIPAVWYNFEKRWEIRT